MCFPHFFHKGLFAQNIKIKINKEFRTKHEYLYLYSPEKKITEEKKCHKNKTGENALCTAFFFGK